MSEESRTREQICRIGRSIFQRGLTFGSSGNISARLDGWLAHDADQRRDWATSTRRGSASSTARDAMSAATSRPRRRFFTSACIAAARLPAAVVHLHSTHSVAVSILEDVDPADVIPPITAYYVMRVGRLPLVPYYRPGDPALGPAVEALADRHHAVLLANHGPGGRGHLARGRGLRHRGARGDRQALSAPPWAQDTHPHAGAGGRREEGIPARLTVRARPPAHCRHIGPWPIIASRANAVW